MHSGDGAQDERDRKMSRPLRKAMTYVLDDHVWSVEGSLVWGSEGT